MTGGGGWPMSVFLTPEGRPFYGGTYFPTGAGPRPAELPAAPRRASTGRGASSAATSSRPARGLVGQLAGSVAERRRGRRPTPELLDTAVGLHRARRFDADERRLGRRAEVPAADDDRVPAPARPRPATPRALPMARRTLDRMADGGIHDQLGGGFHRYATDAIWLVPHFEQMLYDNAQLARVYLHAWAFTGDARYRDGRDGHARLPPARADDGRRRVRREPGRGHRGRGGRDVHVARRRDPRRRSATTRRCSRRRTASPTPATGRASRSCRGSARPPSWRRCTSSPAAEVEARLARGPRAPPGCARQRPQPARDDKALAAWNGLAIAALADAARLLSFAPDGRRGRRPLPGGRGARRRARSSTGCSAPDGRLGRSWKDGRATGQGVLEDYANLAEGLLALYEATFDERWFTTARPLADAILERFADPEGGFFDTATDHERLVTRPKDIQDNATPSGGAMATLVLLRLAALDRRVAATATAAERAARDRHGRTRLATRPRSRCGSRRSTSPSRRVAEVAIVGDPTTPQRRRCSRWLRAATSRIGWSPLRPPRRGDLGPAARGPAARQGPADRLRLPRLRLPAPVTDPEALAAQLAERAAAL